MKLFFGLFLCLLFLNGCRNRVSTKITSLASEIEVTPSYAKGFSIFKSEDYVKIDVFTPWPGAKDTLSYYLVPKEQSLPKHLEKNTVIRTPISKIIS